VDHCVVLQVTPGRMRMKGWCELVRGGAGEGEVQPVGAHGEGHEEGPWWRGRRH